MAKAGSKGKYNRGKARARARRAPRRSGSAVWSVAMAVIVVLGIVGIVLSETGGGTGKGLKIGDHWHAAFGLYVCDTWLPNPPETPRDASGNIVRHGTDVYAGIHTHADGLIHFEPQSSDDTGQSATVGRYFKYNGWSLSATSFKYDKGVSKKNGDACPAASGSKGGKGTLHWAVNGKAHTGNPASYVPNNNDRIVVAFLPPGKSVTSLGDPPSTSALSNASQSEGGATTVPSTPATAPPNTVATSAPTTPTTAKP